MSQEWTPGSLEDGVATSRLVGNLQDKGSMSADSFMRASLNNGLSELFSIFFKFFCVRNMRILFLKWYS